MRPIASHLAEPDVTEITINGPGMLWAKRSGGWQTYEVPALTPGYLSALTTAMAVYNGLAPAPDVSVVLPGGWRGQIVRPPAVIDGTVSVCIRKHSTTTKTIRELEQEGAFASFHDASFHRPCADEAHGLLGATGFDRLSELDIHLLKLKRERRMREFFEACVQNHKNIVIAGKTGSGKTTFARSLINEVPSSERLITIEDVHELHLPNHPNRVHMLYGYGTGRISADACIAACMRMSPDRLFLAELRGDEAWEYLMALNTGHPGSITTTHANSASATFERIALLVKKSPTGRQIDIDIIRQVLYSTIDVVLYFANWQLVEVFYDPIFARRPTQ